MNAYHFLDQQEAGASLRKSRAKIRGMRLIKKERDYRCSLDQDVAVALWARSSLDTISESARVYKPESDCFGFHHLWVGSEAPTCFSMEERARFSELRVKRKKTRGGSDLDDNKRSVKSLHNRIWLGGTVLFLSLAWTIVTIITCFNL